MLRAGTALVRDRTKDWRIDRLRRGGFSHNNLRFDSPQTGISKFDNSICGNDGEKVLPSSVSWTPSLLANMSHQRLLMGAKAGKAGLAAIGP